MKIIDTHAHLDHVKDIRSALDGAFSVGVEAVVAPGVDLTSMKRNSEFQKEFSKPKIYVALGIHPGNINQEELEETFAFIEDELPKAVAVGEIGLDYWYRWVRKNQDKRDEQKKIFRRLLEMAKQRDIPVIIHSRGAWKDCLQLTKEVDIKHAVFHWYSGPVDILEEILSRGYYISATPSLSYSPEAQRAITMAPVEQTLIETDSPVRFKDGDGDFYAEPKDVFRTLDAYVAIKKCSREEALDVLNANARKVFGLDS